jgi:predicted nicotinamide N-methyase
VPEAFSGQQHTITVSSDGVAAYLTQIIASRLLWLQESIREEIWELASTRLAERSGRSAAPSMTREFIIGDNLTISLHEPSLTGDMLGLKTWSSSLMLARRLGVGPLRDVVPVTKVGDKLRVLELGSGTGLVGITVACMWRAYATLTDLPEIVPNLTKNAQRNAFQVKERDGELSVKALDWADESAVLKRKDSDLDEDPYPVIVAADPLYSPEHPKLLADTVGRWLERSCDARFVVEVPLRDGYERERTDMRRRLQDIGLEIEEEGEDTGFDDWEGSDGQRQEVRYSWSVWKGSTRWCPSEVTTSAASEQREDES